MPSPRTADGEKRPPFGLTVTYEMVESFDAAAASIAMPTRTFAVAVLLGAIKTGQAQSLALTGAELLPKTMRITGRNRPHPRQWTPHKAPNALPFETADWVSPPYRIHRIGNVKSTRAPKDGAGWYLQGPGFTGQGEYIGFMARPDAIKRAEELIHIHEANWPEERLPNG